MLRVQVPVQKEPGAPTVTRKGTEGENRILAFLGASGVYISSCVLVLCARMCILCVLCICSIREICVSGMLRVQVPVQKEPGAPTVTRKGTEGIVQQCLFVCIVLGVSMNLYTCYMQKDVHTAFFVCVQDMKIPAACCVCKCLYRKSQPGATVTRKGTEGKGTAVLFSILGCCTAINWGAPIFLVFYDKLLAACCVCKRFYKRSRGCPLLPVRA
jgi:hypothetical protein